jgi:hypothetical protein
VHARRAHDVSTEIALDRAAQCGVHRRARYRRAGRSRCDDPLGRRARSWELRAVGLPLA